jgi:parallel beta-helix repeat protein
MRTAMAIGTALSLALIANSIHAQGSLTPPGAPGETMKTLDQVEARTLIDTPHTTIDQPGSYYLATNLVANSPAGVISITADNVSLDLNGFSIIGGPSNGNGISISTAADNVQVFNGTIRDCPHLGIYAGKATRCAFRDLVILGNGADLALYAGLNAGSGAIVENCRIENNDHIGLWVSSGGKVVGNTISDNATKGLYITGTGNYVADNIVKGNTTNYNISAGNQLNLLLCEIPETLNWPCSVKLAGTLTCTQAGVDGITVAANDVTIDMAGHTLIGPGANSENGIAQADTFRNLTVRNGKLVHWEGYAGIHASGTSTILSGIQATTNLFGIISGEGATVSDCTVSANIYTGITVGDGSTVRLCTASRNGANGIQGSETYISGCTTRDNVGSGISASDGCRVTDCESSSNGFGSNDGSGIYVIGANCRIDGNTVIGNNHGIKVATSGNFIVRNAASDNTTNYLITANNKVGVIVSAPNSGAISGSTGGAGVGSTDPWANFSF